MLYKVGEKTEKHQLNALKAILPSLGVEDEIQDESMGIWKCLDLLEDCLEEEEFFSLLKVVYKKKCPFFTTTDRLLKWYA